MSDPTRESKVRDAREAFKVGEALQMLGNGHAAIVVMLTAGRYLQMLGEPYPGEEDE